MEVANPPVFSKENQSDESIHIDVFGLHMHLAAA